jgi:hypothetical protein
MVTMVEVLVTDHALLSRGWLVMSADLWERCDVIESYKEIKRFDSLPRTLGVVHPVGAVRMTWCCIQMPASAPSYRPILLVQPAPEVPNDQIVYGDMSTYLRFSHDDL